MFYRRRCFSIQIAFGCGLRMGTVFLREEAVFEEKTKKQHTEDYVNAGFSIFLFPSFFAVCLPFSSAFAISFGYFLNAEAVDVHRKNKR